MATGDTTDTTITLVLEWEHALWLPVLIDAAVAAEEGRLKRQKTPRWQKKTEAKIAAGKHLRHRLADAIRGRINI